MAKQPDNQLVQKYTDSDDCYIYQCDDWYEWANFSVGPGAVQAELTEQTAKTDGSVITQEMIAAFKLIEPLEGLSKFSCSDASSILSGLAGIAALFPEVEWLQPLSFVMSDAGRVGSIGRGGLSLGCDLGGRYLLTFVLYMS